MVHSYNIMPSMYQSCRIVPRNTSRSKPESTPVTLSACFCTNASMAFSI